MTALTDTTVPGYFQASFSPKAGYYVLGYKGPEVPWQRLIETGSGDDRECFFFFSHLNSQTAFLGHNADHFFLFIFLFFLGKRSKCVIGR